MFTSLPYKSINNMNDLPFVEDKLNNEACNDRDNNNDSTNGSDSTSNNDNDSDIDSHVPL